MTESNSQPDCNRKRKADDDSSDDSQPKKKTITTDKSSHSSKKSTRVVKLKRSKGEIVQGCDVYIGRRLTMGGWNLPGSKWANPFTIKQCGSAEIAVQKYREHVINQPDLFSSLPELEGKVLGCWCKPGVCHGDVLVDLIKEKKQIK
eukprot:TRINITY_DN4078_c0_g1_i4.p1 TRINITY_DN4078_c0_g1~~TRINITY_DN4078_c0_g1_i4.p1  ORF type:complete len:147 (+),score=19.20 TRINITY_DN4078_c0_g1_i4:111-551(+)